MIDSARDMPRSTSFREMVARKRGEVKATSNERLEDHGNKSDSNHADTTHQNHQRPSKPRSLQHALHSSDPTQSRTKSSTNFNGNGPTRKILGSPNAKSTTTLDRRPSLVKHNSLPMLAPRASLTAATRPLIAGTSHMPPHHAPSSQPRIGSAKGKRHSGEADVPTGRSRPSTPVKLQHRSSTDSTHSNGKSHNPGGKQTVPRSKSSNFSGAMMVAPTQSVPSGRSAPVPRSKSINSRSSTPPGIAADNRNYEMSGSALAEKMGRLPNVKASHMIQRDESDYDEGHISSQGLEIARCDSPYNYSGKSNAGKHEQSDASDYADYGGNNHGSNTEKLSLQLSDSSDESLESSSGLSRANREDISCLKKENRPQLPARPKFKPPPELPRWNIIAKAPEPPLPSPLTLSPMESDQTKKELFQRYHSTTSLGSGIGLGSSDSLSRSHKSHNASRDFYHKDAHPLATTMTATSTTGDEDKLSGNLSKTTKFPPTIYQQELYLWFHPNPDDNEISSLRQDENNFCLSQCWHSHVKFYPDIFTSALYRFRDEHPILRAKLHRNDLIVDADIEGSVDRNLRSGSRRAASQGSSTESLDTTGDELSTFYEEVHGVVGSSDDDEKIWNYIGRWVSNAYPIQVPFKVFLFREACDASGCGWAGSQEDCVRMVMVASTGYADQLTLTWAARELFHIYVRALKAHERAVPEAYRGKYAHNQFREATAEIDSYETPEETYDFLDFAYDEAHEFPHRPAKQPLHYWEQQLSETFQEFVEGQKREELESKLRRVTAERDGHRIHRDSLMKRKPDLEAQTADLRQQRRRIDEQHANATTVAYTDNVTGEIIQITQDAKQALIKTVLGDEAAEDNVAKFLEKHDFSKQDIERLKADTMTIEMFIGLDDFTVSECGLLSKDKRKVLALADFVRNRVRECIQEQSKVKYTLERKILKIQREVDQLVVDLKKTQNMLDRAEDKLIKIHNILHPPLIETSIRQVSLLALGSFDAPPEGQGQSKDVTHKHGFIPVRIEKESVEKLRYFYRDFKSEKRRRRIARRKSEAGPVEKKDAIKEEYVLSSGEDSSDPSDVEMEANLPNKSMEAICLAAFGIVLKHITGTDKFLLGNTLSSRRRYNPLGALAGPFTNTVPIKVDLTSATMTFHALLAGTVRTLREAKKFGSMCPLPVIAKHLKRPELTLPVRFEYFSEKDKDAWCGRGLTLGDLLLIPPDAQDRGEVGDMPPFQRVWASNEDFELKLVLAEHDGTIVGGVHYDKTRLDEEKVTKWVEKLESTIDNIEAGSRRITVATIVSRYYHSIWQSSSNLHGSHRSLGSMADIFSSSGNIFSSSGNIFSSSANLTHSIADFIASEGETNDDDEPEGES